MKNVVRSRWSRSGFREGGHFPVFRVVTSHKRKKKTKADSQGGGRIVTIAQRGERPTVVFQGQNFPPIDLTWEVPGPVSPNPANRYGLLFELDSAIKFL